VANVFFDTNVILYLASAEDAKANRAEELIAEGGIVSAQVLNEFTAVAVRKLRMEWGEIREILSVVRTLCTVKPVEIETHELGLDLAQRFRFPIYDALIIAAASIAGCSVLNTEDLHHGKRIEGMTIQNPFIG
jgi:predicted nucleic acid-binding protein